MLHAFCCTLWLFCFARYGINYWCIECVCKKPAIRRMARLNPQELEKVLPGSTTLEAADVERVCALLNVPLPSAEQRQEQAQGRNRSTRSGRTFGRWGTAGQQGGAEEGAGEHEAKENYAEPAAKRAKPS